MTAPPPLFALRLGLGPIPASVEDLRHEIAHRLDAHEPRVLRRDADLEVLLTIAAGDVWVAVLVAMAAVTGAGYPVVDLEARPLDQAS